MNRQYASVWTRLGALVIDGLFFIPFYIPFYILLLRHGDTGFANVSGWVVFVNLMVLFAGVIFTFWNGIIRMGKTGQSLGRKFLNIAVLNDKGQPIGVGKAALREIIGRWISSIVCYIGYLNAFWDDRRQMWHDKIAKCFVYYVEDEFS